MPIYLIAGIFIVVATVFLITNTLSKVKESTGKLEQISRELLQRLQNLETKMESTEKTLNENLTAMRKEQREESRLSREEQTKGITSFGDVQSKRIKEIGDLQRESLDSFAKQLTDISRLNEEKLESVRDIIEKKLIELHKSNEEKLEKMRETVDEKLHSTLEKRLGEAFKNVSERLEQVHVGLGEMKALTSDVGDLKKVLSNVKVRGTWGEMQLKSLLDQILTEDQYKENVATRPKSTERVEFAICLPGADDNIKQIWLPIDSKFPMEDYQKLVTASEENDTKGIDEARKALRTRVISEAKDIKNKYIETPYTTDFGIL
ncbi:MAG: DNA recombination protein RmuC, partial [Synergistaceae bacterium]